MDNQIISYMQEQLPDIKGGYEDATVCGDPDYADYLSGIIEAYEHIVEKFGSYEAP
jgi:hypothetical protein